MEEKFLPEYLTALICTRMSHDLIGNVGAVANAVELLEEGDLDFMDEIRSILKVSSNVLSARLKFFRLVFGLSNSNLTDISTVKKISEAYLQTIGNASYPITLNLNVNQDIWARQALVMIMILADVLVKGGVVDVREVGEKLVAKVYSEAPLAKEKILNIKALLDGKIPENQAQYAPVVYLQNILNNNKKVNIIEEDTFGFIIS